jgi:hypothetical protein
MRNRQLIARWCFEKGSTDKVLEFINPVFTLVEDNGKITDVKAEYPDDFVKQMQYYSANYSYRPTS